MEAFFRTGSSGGNAEGGGYWDLVHGLASTYGWPLQEIDDMYLDDVAALSEAAGRALKQARITAEEG